MSRTKPPGRTLLKPKPIEKPTPIRRNGLMFDIPQPSEVPSESKPMKEKKPKPEKIKRKADPRLANAARELRDRWLEQINAAPLLPAGKYDVTRAIEGPSSGRALDAVKLLAA